MTVVNSTKDFDNKTMTVECEFQADIGSVWQLWADPRKLERWWGPPTYPSTFVDHDLTPGGVMRYYMTGPEGDKPAGWWKVISVDEPNQIQFQDGFGDGPDSAPSDLPVMEMVVVFNQAGSNKTTMTIKTLFPSKESMEQVIAMGMEEGMNGALGQIDAILSE